MNPGELNTVLTFKPVTSAVSSGDMTETEGTPVTIRCKLKMIDGYKKMQYTELLNKETYEANCYNNSALVSNAVCTYGSVTLVVHSVIKNLGNSGTNEVKLILYKK